MTASKKQASYSAESRGRAVRIEQEHDEHASEWAAVESNAAKICCTAHSLQN